MQPTLKIIDENFVRLRTYIGAYLWQDQVWISVDGKNIY